MNRTDKLIQENMGAIWEATEGWTNSLPETPSFSREDLFQEGVLAVVKAIRYYKKKMGKVTTFIFTVVSRHLSEHVYPKQKKKREHAKEHSTEHLGSYEQKNYIPSQTPDVISRVNGREMIAALERGLDTDEMFALQCYVNPPSDLWRLARRRKLKCMKKQNKKLRKVRITNEDVIVFLTDIGGEAWAKYIVREMKRKVNAIAKKY